MSPLERTALFLDGANLYSTARALGFEVDFKRLNEHFRSETRLVRAFYCTTIFDEDDYRSIRPLVDWLAYNGYTLITKPAREFTDQYGQRKIKGKIDVELAVHAMQISQHIDRMILFSGDGDFQALVAAMQRRGVQVSVISSIASRPSALADELRRQADEFIELATLINIIGRETSSASTLASRVAAR